MLFPPLHSKARKTMFVCAKPILARFTRFMKTRTSIPKFVSANNTLRTTVFVCANPIFENIFLQNPSKVFARFQRNNLPRETCLTQPPPRPRLLRSGPILFRHEIKNNTLAPLTNYTAIFGGGVRAIVTLLLLLLLLLQCSIYEMARPDPAGARTTAICGAKQAPIPPSQEGPRPSVSSAQSLGMQKQAEFPPKFKMSGVETMYTPQPVGK